MGDTARKAKKDLAEVDFTQEEVRDLVEKTINFIEIFCARDFYPYQTEFARSIITDVYDNRANVLTGLFARQSGKSETAANVTAGLMVLLPTLANLKADDGPYVYPQLAKFRRGVYVGIFAPSGLQATTTYKRLRDRITSYEAKQVFLSGEFAPKGDTELKVVSSSLQTLELSNRSQCIQLSADKQANIESKTFHIIVLDESQDLDEFVVNKSIMPMGAHTNASTIATGTPGMTKSFFYNTIKKNEGRQAKYGQQQLHFQYDYKVCQKYNKNYKKYIKKEKERIGEDSDEFRMAYKLHWLLERGMAVSDEQFDRLTIKSRNIITSFKEGDLIAGLDFGKGQDSTVLTIGKPNWDEVDESGKAPCEVINWWEKVGDDYESIFAELKTHISNFGIKTMACDATGVGEPLVDRLIWELPMVTIIPVKFSAQSKDHLYKNFLLYVQEQKVTWPGDSRLRKRKYWSNFHHQMTNLQKEYRGQYLACHAPEDQKDAHDDFPDSLALMLWCLHEEAFPFIEVSTDRDTYKGENWNDITRERYTRYNKQFSLKG